MSCPAMCKDHSNVYLVSEHLSGGDLFQHLSRHWERNQARFSLNNCKLILAEITAGVDHLHSHGFLRRDLTVQRPRGRARS